MDEEKQGSFSGWALVEMMGHRRVAGEVETFAVGRDAFLRVVTPEVPETEYVLDHDAFINGERIYAGSKMAVSRPRSETAIGTGSIYAVTVISEADVLQFCPLKQRVIERAARPALEAGGCTLPDADNGEERRFEDAPF